MCTTPLLGSTGSPGLIAVILTLANAIAPSNAAAQSPGAPPAAPSEPIDWAAAEAGILEQQTQLTFPDRFVRAGEAYFSPDGRRVIFQAVEQPTDGSEPEGFYAMFVADLVDGGAQSTDGERGEPRWRLENIRRISPAGSANTCGWFHPSDPDRILFASTIGPPTESSPPGYQRGTSRYRWSFPPETRLVEVDLRKLPLVPLKHDRAAAGASGTAPTFAADIPKDALKVLYGDGRAYAAEGSISKDGRTLLFCSLESNLGDLFVLDLASGAVTPIVEAPGYDGGPFFSPDGHRICYRSDRAGDNHLQLYVADLIRDEDGRVTGAGPEYAVTANLDVNWCPYWHPAGAHLVYATSAMGHRNYEVFIVDAKSDDESWPPQRRYGTNPRRVTNADGADVLPVFDATGRRLMWTSQRAPDRSSQLWIADFVMPLEPVRADPGVGRPGAAPAERGGTHGGDGAGGGAGNSGTER